MRTKIAGVLVAVAALLLAGTTPAFAGSKTVTDQRGDVTTSVNGKGVGKAPDITSVRVSYGGDRARVVVKFKKLTQKNITNVNIYFDTDRDGNDNRGINVQLKKGKVKYRIFGEWSITVFEKDDYPVTVTRDLGKGGKVIVVYPTYYLGKVEEPPPTLGVVVDAHKLIKKGSLGSDWAPKGNSLHGKNKWIRVTHG